MRHGLIFLAVVLCGLGLFAVSDEAEAVTLISDARLTLPEFAQKNGQDPSLFETRYAATGMVICSGVYSTAQLTIRHDVVTTAAHAFFDADGRPRGNLSSCVFAIAIDGVQHAIPIDANSLRVGSRNPYAVSPVHDWAVVRLTEGVPNARPYALGTAEAESAGTGIVMLAHRHRGWVHDGRKAIEACMIRTSHRIESASAREIAIDCSAGEGASGSAIMLPGSSCAMVGIYVGWRSTHPDKAGPFSETHMNFGVAIEGPFRNAIMAMTNGPDTEPAQQPPAATPPVAQEPIRTQAASLH